MNNEIIVKEELNLDIAKEKVDMFRLMEMSKMLAKSTIIPITYQNREENVYIALDMATRMGCSPMMVMQNLHVIQGKPSFSGATCNALVKNCGRFKNVKEVYIGTPNTDSWGCYLTAQRVSDGTEIKGATVTIGTAKAEGWYQKTGSKWKNMPELMLAYRASAWFARVYAPEVTMGLQTIEEVEDITTTVKSTIENPYEVK